MKVLVATSITQGERATDSTDCIDGELVWMLDPCPTSVRDPDGPCECGRSFSGMNSHGSTTTAMIRDIPYITPANYAAALRASFDAQGWCSCCTARSVDEVVDDLLGGAALLPEGAIVERRLDQVRVRRAPIGRAGGADLSTGEGT